MKIGVLLVAAVLVEFVTNASAAEKPTVEQLLTEYQKSIEKLTRFRIESIEKIWLTGSSDPRFKDNKDGYVGTTERTIYHDSSRSRYSRVDQLILNGLESKGRVVFEYLVGDYLDKRQALHTYWSDSRLAPQQAARLTLRLDDHVEPAPNIMGTSAILFGHYLLDGDRPLWNVMRDASTVELSPETEMVGGSPTWVVKSRGRFGQHVLWLDTKAGGLPRRIDIQKTAGDRVADIQLGVETSPSKRERRLRGAPQKKIFKEQHLTWDRIEIAEKQGMFVITAFESTNTTLKVKDDKEERETYKIEYRTSAIDFDPSTWPQNAFLPGVEIPNGTKVATKDGTSVVWENGNVRKAK